MYSVLELINRLRTETVRVSESELPLEVFPQKVHEIISELYNSGLLVDLLQI